MEIYFKWLLITKIIGLLLFAIVMLIIIIGLIAIIVEEIAKKMSKKN